MRLHRWVIGSLIIVASLVSLGSGAKPPRYLNPVDLAVSADGNTLYVVCSGSDELLFVRTADGVVEERVPTGHVPKGVALSRNGKRLFVTNSWADTVTEIDAGNRQVLRTFKTGFEPIGAVTDNADRFLYTANRLSHDISVIDVEQGSEIRRIPAGRGSSFVAASGDGSTIVGTHIYPRLTAHRTEPESELTFIDAQHQIAAKHVPLSQAAGVFFVKMSADGKLGLATGLRPKNLVPLAHVAHGSSIGNGLVLFGEAVGEPVQILLDEIDRYYALPYGLALSSDGKRAYAGHAGSDVVSIIDLPKLLAVVRGSSPEQRKRLGNDLSLAARFVIARVKVGINPAGLALSPDNQKLYVTNRLDDTATVIDTVRLEAVQTFALGGPADATPERRGARLFSTARYAFHQQFSCASCHLDETIDGLEWDLEPDGFGKDIVDNRLLEDVAETAPYKWNGGNPDLQTECGPRTEKFFFRSQGYSPQELDDLVRYIKSMPMRPNRFRLPSGELTAAQERGRDIFERTRRRNGQPIPEELQCPVCHSGKHYTNLQLADVGTGKPTDRSPEVDVPQLNGLMLSAPYLHDGSARTLEEIWTVYNPRDTHGVTNDLNKDELNDLIEYLKTL